MFDEILQNFCHVFCIVWDWVNYCVGVSVPWVVVGCFRQAYKGCGIAFEENMNLREYNVVFQLVYVLQNPHSETQMGVDRNWEEYEECLCSAY